MKFICLLFIIAFADGVQYSLFLEKDFEYINYSSAYYRVIHASHPAFTSNEIICLETYKQKSSLGIFKRKHVFVHAINQAMTVTVIKISRTLHQQQCNSVPKIYLI